MQLNGRTIWQNNVEGWNIAHLPQRLVFQIVEALFINQRHSDIKKDYKKRNDAGENLHLYHAEKGDKARV